MSGEKVPKDLGGGYARCGIEIRIEWDLTGDVHGDRVPGVNSSDEPIKLYLRFPAAICCILLDDRGDVPLAVAQWCQRSNNCPPTFQSSSRKFGLEMRHSYSHSTG